MLAGGRDDLGNRTSWDSTAKLQLDGKLRRHAAGAFLLFRPAGYQSGESSMRVLLSPQQQRSEHAAN